MFGINNILKNKKTKKKFIDASKKNTLKLKQSNIYLKNLIYNIYDQYYINIIKDNKKLKNAYLY